MPASRPALIALHLAVYGAAGWPMLADRPLAGLVFGALLIWISVHDFQTFEIPDTASAVLALTGLAAALTQPRTMLWDHLAGGLLWPLVFWGVAASYRGLRGAHGLGLGDVKLMAGIGLWCGAIGTVWVVLAAALAGMASLVLLSLHRRKPLSGLGQSAVAFGPFLCLSAWVQWAWGLGL